MYSVLTEHRQRHFALLQEWAKYLGYFVMDYGIKHAINYICIL